MILRLTAFQSDIVTEISVSEPALNWDASELEGSRISISGISPDCTISVLPPLNSSESPIPNVLSTEFTLISILPELPDRDSLREFRSLIVRVLSKSEIADSILKEPMLEVTGGSGSEAADGSGSEAAGGSGSEAAGGSGSKAAGSDGGAEGGGGGGGGRFSLVFEAMVPTVPTTPTPAAIVEGDGEFSLSLLSKSRILPSHALLAGERMKVGRSSIFLAKAEFAVSIA